MTEFRIPHCGQSSGCVGICHVPPFECPAWPQRAGPTKQKPFLRLWPAPMPTSFEAAAAISYTTRKANRDSVFACLFASRSLQREGEGAARLHRAAPLTKDCRARTITMAEATNITNPPCLLPCPFCGGAAEVGKLTTGHTSIWCSVCRAEGSRRAADVFAAWNRRAAPPSPQTVAERRHAAAMAKGVTCPKATGCAICWPSKVQS